MKKFFDSDAWAWIKTVIEILLIVAAGWLAIRFYTSLGFAGAEDARPEDVYETGYVLCAPGDVVNVRRKPSRSSVSIGRFEPGEQVYLDGKKRNGFLHCVYLSLEESEGWIHAGYIVGDRPERLNRTATIVSAGRLRARKYVKGRRTRWLKRGAAVLVYYWSDEWCVTNCGYLQSRYLELDGE